MINENLNKIRDLMKKHDLNMYYVTTSDYHNSEYLGEHFKARAFLSGFTGSQGTLIITLTNAYLWVDGRYFIQAENQIKNTEIILMKMGQENVPTIFDFIKNNLKGKLGLDGKCSNIKFVKSLIDLLDCQVVDVDLVSPIWTNRPLISDKKAFELAIQYAGKTTKEKLQPILEVINDNMHIVTALDEICWLLNIRGNDIAHTPVVLSYLIIEKTGLKLFIDKNKLDTKLTAKLTADNIEIYEYNDFYNFLTTIKNRKILLDFSKNNYAIYHNTVSNNTLVDFVSPIDLAKAIKNPVEIENTIQAHIKDGVAMVNFIYYLKHLDTTIDEYQAANYIDQQRMQQQAIDLSFGTISAFKENAAMMHYSANPKTAKKIDQDGMLLVDSGGHYLLGSTDITRTIMLGKPTKTEKFYYTNVLKSNLNLAHAKFLYGCSGLSLDILARNPIWQLDIDYQCGTGHGVGHILNVHEGPQGFRWKTSPLRKENQVLEAGMVITDEPGVYLKDQLGIRIENELLVTKGEKNEYGQFMHFKVLTYCPMDKDLIDVDLLTKQEIQQLNDYHAVVYDTLKDLLSEDVRQWLKKECEKI